MGANLNLVTKWLLDASMQIEDAYIQLPVVETDPKYRERVYCYELYHRWRCHWQSMVPYMLAGEIDKSGHPLIRNMPKPDFLVHIPGMMDNLLVVEVKPQNANVDKMVEDLIKLTTFRRDLKGKDKKPANYEAAYFWIYGADKDVLSPLKAAIIQKSQENPKIDLSLIRCVVHYGNGTRAVFVNW